jgi:cyclohexadieny/prephenate dehydrogenase
VFLVARFMPIDTLTVVGVGLIGGSIGLAARQRQVARRVLGVGRCRESLDRAIALGAIAEGFVDPVPAVRGADLVILCTPVDHIAAQAVHLAYHCRPGTLLTDAGSTKSAIVRAVETRLPAGVRFVGSHPLAGSEKRGVEHGDADLFLDRMTVVTRTEHTDGAALEQVSAFWRELGSRVRVMSPEEHDWALAQTSHLPHLLASALAGILPHELTELAATGFRDTTRIAAGDPSLWTSILSQNRVAVLDALARLRQRLDLFQQALEIDNVQQLDFLLATAKGRRDALGT